MDLRIRISEDEAPAVKAQAQAEGLTVEQWIEKITVQFALSQPASIARTRPNGKDKAREFVEWAKSHPVTPPLSDEAISRASLNPDRW